MDESDNTYIDFDYVLGEMRLFEKPVIEKTEKVVEIRSGGGSLVFVGLSPPSNIGTGSLWYDTSASKLKIYINGSWVEISGSAVADGTFDFMDGNDLQFMDGNSAAYMSG